MQALWGEPWTARSVSVDGNEVVPFRGDVTDLWLLAKQCTVTQWRQGPVERRRNGGAAQGSHWLVIKEKARKKKKKNWLVRFYPEDSIPLIGCFLSAFVHLLQTLSKKVSRSTATEVESGISDANRRFLVCESLETGKEGQNACQKNSDRVCLKGQLNTDAVGEETKNRALEPASFRKEIIVNQSQRKAKSQYGICAGFWFDRRGHKAKRSDARFIYIYNREWRKSKSTRNCGARWGSPQLILYTICTVLGLMICFFYVSFYFLMFLFFLFC